MTHEERLKALKIAVIQADTTVAAIARDLECSTAAIYAVLRGDLTSGKIRDYITERFPTVKFEDDAA
jgi:hypothetical protein